MWIAVIVGFGLVLLVTTCIIADVVAGRPRRKAGSELTVGEVTRVRGPLRGQVDGDAPSEYIEVTAQYYTRGSDGPFEAVRRLPVSAAKMYAKGERVVVSYDCRHPRRGQLTGRLPSAAQ
ncbi:DUF3592 domain-containing protein [Kribbella deserti]|uniref:DUF3592 domain-containing protein n=1 Tax=Kribbella deserti TaxID=1926257 RepID=A0ABV6QIM6_9ACTN